jgi:hypothetical protein
MPLGTAMDRPIYIPVSPARAGLDLARVFGIASEQPEQTIEAIAEFYDGVPGLRG